MSIPWLPLPPETLLHRLHAASLAAADPGAATRRHLPEPPPPPGRLRILALGKAAPGMAAAALDHAPGAEALAIAPHGTEDPGLSRLRLLTAAHPIPDAAGLTAAAAVETLLESLQPEDLLLVLLSGGGSALLPAPPQGLTLQDLQDLTRGLLASGLPIQAMNAIRRHASRLAGGRLAARAWPAATRTLILSDVPGDDPAAIASGPTVPDPSSCAEALAIARQAGLALPPALESGLESGALETPKPGDPRLARASAVIIGSGRLALAAALAESHRLCPSLPVSGLGDRLEGEARHLAASLVATALTEAGTGALLQISGGEATVTLQPPPAAGATGGRNTATVLAALLALEAAGRRGWILAAGSDGQDGVGPQAGALGTPQSLDRMRQTGLDPAAALAAHDSGGAFAAIQGLLPAGLTGTNVNDLRFLLLEPQEDLA